MPKCFRAFAESGRNRKITVSYHHPLDTDIKIPPKLKLIM